MKKFVIALIAALFLVPPLATAQDFGITVGTDGAAMYFSTGSRRLPPPPPPRRDRHHGPHGKKYRKKMHKREKEYRKARKRYVKARGRYYREVYSPPHHKRHHHDDD